MGTSPTALSRVTPCVDGDSEQLLDSRCASCRSLEPDVDSAAAGYDLPTLISILASKRIAHQKPTHAPLPPAKLDYRASLTEGEDFVQNTQRLVAAYLQDCRSRSLKPKTIVNYEWALKRLFETFPTVPTAQDLIWLIAEADLSSESRLDLWRILSQFFKWAAVHYDFPDPMTGVERPRREHKIPRTLERVEIDRLLDVSRDNPRDHAMIAVLLDTGIRLNELTNLRHPHIQETRLLIAEPKGGRQRYVPISPDVKDQLLALGDGYHIWVGQQPGRRLGEPMTRDGVQQAIKRTFRKAGIRPPKAGPHVLRHTFGRWYVKNGGDVFHLQRILGHRDVQTTMIYVTLNTDDLEEQHAAVSPYLQFINVSRETPDDPQGDVANA